MVVDLLFFSPPWTHSLFASAGISSGIAFGYWFWVELCNSRNGWYPYPIMDLLSTPYRALLFGFSAAIFTGLFEILKLMYRVVNGKGRVQYKPKAVPGNLKKTS